MENSHEINAKELKERVSLTDLLSRLGFQPVKTSGKELRYLSMLRDSDTTPSFSVNEQLGVWYDHGMGKGGNLIDFGLAYWHLPFKETLEKIVTVCDTVLPIETPGQEYAGRKRSAIKIPNYKVKEIKDLGNNPAITEYLSNRGIWEAAQQKLKEVYYYVEDQKKQRKYFFAAGWQNELGAWEVRNLYFKGCLGHKAISFIPGNSNRLSVFEGYINYLSWLTENPYVSDSVLILNTTALLQSGIRKAQDYGVVNLYFDRDHAGHQASTEFIAAVPHSSDCSGQYLDFNDYNDKLRAGLRNTDISR